MTESNPSACLVSTGEEVLRGEIFDTNNHYLANVLGAHGFAVQMMMTAGDRERDLRFAMESALQQADFLFMSGGLGPTEDDLTTAVAAELAGRALVFDETSWRAIVALFHKYKLEPGDNNRKQAMLPEGADILANHHGTAPGFCLSFEQRGRQKTIVALPGPPRELQPMIGDWLKHRGYRAIPPEEHLFLHFLGIGESPLAEILEPWCRQWGEVSFRQDFPEMEVKLYQPPLEKRLSLCRFARQNLAAYLTTYSRQTVPELFTEFMHTNGLSLALAESCTGGLAAKIVSDTPHSSDYFLGGVVSYVNAIKTSALGVSADLLATDGPFNGETAEQMARGVRERFQADLALSFTGIAGPDGGSEEKPVGSVWLGKADSRGSQSTRIKLLPERDRVRTAAVSHGLRWLMEDWLKERYQGQLESWAGG